MTLEDERVAEAAKQAAETSVLVVLLADGSLVCFPAGAKLRILPVRRAEARPSAFLAHELADEYEERAEALRIAIEELS